MNIPEGFKLVPVELTEEMLEVLHSNVKIQVDTWERTADIINDREWWAAVVEAAPTPPQPIYDDAAELNRLFGAATEMLRIAGIANQGSNAYNRAIVNLHEAVTACAQSRAKSVGVGHE